MPNELLYLLGGLLSVGYWWRKKRRFRQDQLVNVTEGRSRVTRLGGGF